MYVNVLLFREKKSSVELRKTQFQIVFTVYEHIYMYKLRKIAFDCVKNMAGNFEIIRKNFSFQNLGQYLHITTYTYI